MATNEDTKGFEEEEVVSTLTYPPEYSPSTLGDQLAILHAWFPELEHDDPQVTLRDLPEGAESWFALPRWQRIAPRYDEAVARVLVLLDLARAGKVTNRRQGRLALLCEHDHTAAMFDEIGKVQSGDILIVPGQFGQRHRGRSVRRARSLFLTTEFGLGTFHVAVLLLTHPRRLTGETQLRIDCAGDRFDLTEAPLFSHEGERLAFGAATTGESSASYGSATGFGVSTVTVHRDS